MAVKQSLFCLYLIEKRQLYNTGVTIFLLFHKLGQINYHTHTFVVNEDITIKAVPKQQDVIRVFEIDVCSGEQMGVETAEKKGGASYCLLHFIGNVWRCRENTDCKR